MNLDNLNDNDIVTKTESLTNLVQQKQERHFKAIEKYKRNFAAGQYNRLNSSWTAIDFSPAQELWSQLGTLKVRSRDLYVNSPVVNNLVSLLQQNVVGNKGFAFRSKVINAKGAINNKLAKQIEEAWADFCKPNNLEITGLYGLIDALDIMIQSLAIDGEILIKKIYGEGKYGFVIQMLHSEQLPITDNSNYSEYKLGIKRNAYGRPIEYSIYNIHPSEGYAKLLPEPAEHIIHAFIPYQVNAPRGIPFATASMPTIKMLDEYRKAELVAARAEASAFIKITQKQPDDLDQDIFLDSALPSSTTRDFVQPGMGMVMAPGTDAEYVTAKHPNTAFESFDKALKKEISAGLGISYNSLYSDYENTSFSSMRAAYISERAFYRKVQNLIIEKVLMPIFESWIDTACASGRLNLPPVMGNYDFYKACEFTGKAYEYSNPLQEAEAQKLLVECRLRSKTQICAENGTSYSDILDDLKAEQDLEGQKGLNFAVLPKNTELQVVPSKLETTALVAPATSNNKTV